MNYNDMAEMQKKINGVIEKYTLADGTVFKEKMLLDLSMWLDFAHDFGIDKIGILRLRSILGDPHKFKNKYVNK